MWWNFGCNHPNLLRSWWIFMESRFPRKLVFPTWSLREILEILFACWWGRKILVGHFSTRCCLLVILWFPLNIVELIMCLELKIKLSTRLLTLVPSPKNAVFHKNIYFDSSIHLVVSIVCVSLLWSLWILPWVET